jgi:hypothetical protein
MGVLPVDRLFPTASRVEMLRIAENLETEYRITYANGRDFEMDTRAAAALVRAWPDQVDSIMPEVFPNLDHYGVRRWGLYVGIEYDGYIHT